MAGCESSSRFGCLDLCGDYFKALHRNYRKPTIMMVLLVEGIAIQEFGTMLVGSLEAQTSTVDPATPF